MNPILTPPDEVQRKKKEQAALSANLGMKKPGSPVAAPDAGIAAKPKTIDIGGIPHLDLPDQKFPGPLGMAADAMAGTVGYIATAPFGNRAEERLAANRAELNNETAEPQSKVKPPVTTPTGITGGSQAAATRGIADLPGRQAGHMVENNLRQFEDKGNAIARQVGADGRTTFTNVGTADVTDPTKKVADNSYNGAADNEAMARANAIRQTIIDRQPVGGVGILGDGGVEAANAEKTTRWRQDELLQEAKYGNRAAGDAIHANAKLAGDQIHSATAQRGQDITGGITVRGQDIHAQTEASRIAGNPVDNQLKQAQTRLVDQRTEDSQGLTDLRNKLLTETDPAKRGPMQEALLTAMGRDPNQGRYVRLGGGDQVIDPLTGQKARAPDQVFDSRTGQTVQPGQRSLSDADFEAIGKKIGLPADAIKARHSEFKSQKQLTSLNQFNSVDVALSLAEGVPAEKIAATIKRLGGNPAEYGL